MRNENLLMLRKLTDELQSLPVLLEDFDFKCGQKISYPCVYGEVVGYGLLKRPSDCFESVAVCDAEFSKDCFSVIHAHKEHEYTIVYCGSLDYVEYNEDGVSVAKKRRLTVGDMIYVLPEVKHAFGSVCGGRAIFITVPASEGFPNGSPG